MMMRTRLALVAGSLLVLAATPAVAHHSFAAEYDRNKQVNLTGTVTKVDWMNPHMYFYIDVKDANGSVTSWGLENGNLSGLMRRGWRKDSLKIGDVVTVEGFLAKDGTHIANARSVKLSDGRKMFSGQFGEENEK
jgi:hypothetical protein